MITFEPPKPAYQDRNHAGHILAEKLEEYFTPDLIILAIPNGSIPVAVPVAKIFEVPLRLMLVRKLQQEFTKWLVKRVLNICKVNKLPGIFL